MVIRPYATRDRQPCLEILEGNSPEFFLPQERDDLAAFLDELPGPYFVLEERGRIDACGGWAIDPDDVAVMTWGMVRRELHRRGLGRQLLRFRLNDIRHNSAATRVRVRTVSLTQGFFIREGFAIVDVVPDGYGAGLDKVTMEASVQFPPDNPSC
jgi:N-acetylglutamate synthase-like GNAT family acetyltransferase